MSRRICLVALTLMMMMLEVEPITLHRVGGGQFTWNPNVNISDWAIQERFHSGEWLYFGFDSTSHNVLQVNKSSYERCIDTDFISNVTRGGRDVFQLLEPKPYYFICGRGYCTKGMKLAINVLPQPSPSTPIPDNFITPAASTATTLIPSNALVVVATASLTFIFKALNFV